MITCPNCGKAVAGRATVCGYCGESLLRDYFSRRDPPEQYPTLGAGSAAAAVLGVFGALSLLTGLIFSLAPLFSAEAGFTGLSIGWWIRTLLLAVLAPVHLVQQLVLHGLRFSLLFDSFWLFLSVLALGFVGQAWFYKGAALFDGITAVAYLLALGCILIAVSCATGILSFHYQKEKKRA